LRIASSPSASPHPLRHRRLPHRRRSHRSEFLPISTRAQSGSAERCLPAKDPPPASTSPTKPARNGVLPGSHPGCQPDRPPDDGTDTTGFFNTEYFVDLKRKEQWRPVFHENKEAVIAAMNTELSKFPGVIWNFSQPISDNMEEAVSGVKGELAVKLYATTSAPLSRKPKKSRPRCKASRELKIWASFESSASPTSTTSSTAMPPPAGHQRGRYPGCCANRRRRQRANSGAARRSRFDVTLRYQQQYRDTREAIRNIRLLAPTGERVSLEQLTTSTTDDGAEEIYAKPASAISPSSTRARPRPRIDRRRSY